MAAGRKWRTVLAHDVPGRIMRQPGLQVRQVDAEQLGGAIVGQQHLAPRVPAE
jgi:hypothetical protein